MISRVADHCLWFGRYLERSESTARLLAATNALALDAELPQAMVWRPVLIVAGEPTAPDAPLDGEQVLAHMTWDAGNPVALRASLEAARWNARAIRDVVSREVWEVVNELHLWLAGDAARAAWRGARDDFYRHVRRTTQLTLGLLRSTMLHDEPLNFIWLGVLLERVGQTARTLDVHHHALAEVAASAGASGTSHALETALWLMLLRAMSGTEPFARSVHGDVTPARVARFLIDEPRFPRSIAYGVRAALERLQVICGDDAGPERPGVRSWRRLVALDAHLGQGRDDRAPAALHALLTHIVDEIHQACDELDVDLLGRA